MDNEKLGSLTELLAAAAQDAPVKLVVRGDCMSPVLRDGDEILVSYRRHFLPGDIVVFRVPGGILAHRLLGYRLSGGRLAFVTRGDHCTVSDGIVPREAVIGRAETAVSTFARIRAVVSLLGIAVKRVLR